MPEKVAELKRHMTELAAEVEPPAPARQAPRPDGGTEGARKDETS
jgi:hypothetical protein